MSLFDIVMVQTLAMIAFLSFGRWFRPQVPKGPFWKNINVTFDKIEGPINRRHAEQYQPPASRAISFVVTRPNRGAGSFDL